MGLSNITRRDLLKSVGAGAALAPFVPVLDAHGAGSTKRIIFFFSSNGTVREKWLPTMNGNDLVPSEILKPLEPYKSDLLVIDGLGYKVAGWGGHHIPQVLTGAAGKSAGVEDRIPLTLSVDQHIANTISQGLKFRSLEMGIRVEESRNMRNFVAHWRPNSEPVKAVSNTYQTFDRLFGPSFMPPAAPGSAPMPSATSGITRDRRSVINHVLADLTSLRPRIGVDDQRKIDAHLESLRQIERTLETGAGAGATAGCRAPARGMPIDVSQNNNIPLVGRLTMDLMVMAMACDLTRVGSIMFGEAGSSHRFTWLGPEFAVDPDNGPNDSVRGFHALAHNEANPASRAKLARIHTWYAGELAYLIKKLKETPEGGGTMADNTLVVWWNEIGTGSHSRNNTPWVLVQGAGASFRRGRLASFPGVAHQKLLVSLCNAMGLPDQTFGVAEMGNGPLPGLT